MGRRPAVTFVIMAGGRGERLWPLVRLRRPKVCVAPDKVHTLLAATIERLRPVWPGARWLVVTTDEQAEAVRASLPQRLRDVLLIEPQVKNTAAAIALAAVNLAIREPNRIMVVMPADHWVDDAREFQRSVRAAIAAASKHDAIVTIGVRPTHPHPRLGYLCAGARVPAGRGPRVFRVARFIEKPTAVLARRLVKQPRTFWNTGTFIGSADKFLECLTEWLPEHTRRLVPLAQGIGSLAFAHRARVAYRALKPISFEYGVMDYLDGGLVVEGCYAWADLGTWEAWAHLNPDTSHIVSVDSRNVTVVSQEPHLVATVGVNDAVVVHTPTATLICRPDLAHRVREVVRRLSAKAHLAPYR
ncbi:MAG TPA: sugar phosphate nucleotidyltransferase [bacterium]